MKIEELYKIYEGCGSVTTDSRVGGGIFFGLKGDRFDGADFADNALKNGAVCVVTDNSLEVLQRLSSMHRDRLGIPILGITGTNGKTTTKELVVKVLERKFRVGYTRGNFNNHIGVPLTLLSFDRTTEVGVVEMGANHVGEIAALCSISKPNVGLITNVGRAHLEGFGGFEGVVRTKGELYDFLKSSGGVALYNEGDDHLRDMISKMVGLRSEGYVESFSGISNDGGYLCFEYSGKRYETRMVGEYNLHNIAAAMAVGAYFGVEADDALRAICEYEPSNNRSQVLNGERNKVLLDAYNANPSSMREALLNFKRLEGKKVAILGDMRELGEFSKNEHGEVVSLVRECGCEAIFVGEEFRKVFEGAFLSVEDAESAVRAVSGATVLVKGSRGMKMERMAEWL